VYPRWSDEIPAEAVPRYGRKVRLLALIVVITLILLTVVPVLVRVTRQEPSAPTITQPGVVAAQALE
jgi:TRAP-type C4-dicarboxylate transport system permease small subunit